MIPPLGQIDLYRMLNDSEICITDFSKESFQEAITKASAFWNYVTRHEQREVIIIKPHLMKVRSPKYLILIYNYNYQFPNKYKKLLDQKNIKHKLQTSIKEFDLELKMLETPMKEITMNNVEYIKRLIKFQEFEKNEKTLDSRL
jgi:hypothetical protein